MYLWSTYSIIVRHCGHCNSLLTPTSIKGFQGGVLPDVEIFPRIKVLAADIRPRLDWLHSKVLATTKENPSLGRLWQGMGLWKAHKCHPRLWPPGVWWTCSPCTMFDNHVWRVCPNSKLLMPAASCSGRKTCWTRRAAGWAWPGWSCSSSRVLLSAVHVLVRQLLHELEQLGWTRSFLFSFRFGFYRGLRDAKNKNNRIFQ